jgi:type IV pilus assembly protein PilC
MVFDYIFLTDTGEKANGVIDAASKEIAILELQKRGLIIVNIAEKQNVLGITVGSKKKLDLFAPKIKNKDIVVFSRQISTLFEAGVSALKAFRLLADENDNATLQAKLTSISDDIQSGISLSEALSREKELFSPFYVSMVKAGEESGKLNESFLFLADHLDREYELNQKTKKALTYPTFVISTFIVIMVAMFVFVIPKMASLFADQGSTLPLVTRIILGASNFFVNNGLYILPFVVGGFVFFNRYKKTPEGKLMLDTLQTKVPVFRNLTQKIFLARFSDNMNTMLSSGVTIIRSIEITADVVDNDVYKNLLLRALDKVKTGTALSKALYEEPEIPNILVQMVHIGEETGELGFILKNLSNFYKREVDNAVDAVIGLIEPAMIVGLGLGVGVLVSAVLLPMYSLSSAIN